MKKLFAVLLVLMLAVCGFAVAEEDTSVENILEKGTFILGLDDSFPPMGFRDDESNIVGFDVELAKEVASRLGMEIELKPIDWTANVMELNSGSVDCLWNGLSITPEREAEIDFSRPYLANRQVIIVLAGSDIVDIPSLAGKTVGLQDGSSAVSALEKNEIASQVTQQKYADNVTALTDLSIGRVDAVLLDEVVARYYETQNPGVYTVQAVTAREDNPRSAGRTARLPFAPSLAETRRKDHGPELHRAHRAGAAARRGGDAGAVCAGVSALAAAGLSHHALRELPL